ncbi:hypothetical protein [Streptomyces sp. NPDC058240]|uniref:hypothetical protein n=1 Tax=Streptomyces sp. NPDC058240 TaxID=3346396 RepID=UPI0036EA6C11
MATDGWQQVRAATVALWRRTRPDRAAHIGAELDVLRAQVLAAREADDEDTEQALTGAWRLCFQQVIEADPAFAAELRALLDDHLGPVLPQDERPETGPVVMKAEAHDNAKVFMAGRDQHITGE